MSIADPATIDIVTEHSRDGYVALIMIEDEGWAEPLKSLEQVQAKLNTYLSYALDGQLQADHPDLADQRVRVQLDTTTLPPQSVAQFLKRIAGACKDSGVEFVVNQL